MFHDLKDILSERKLKATEPRLALLTLLSNYGSAMPYSKLQAEMTKYDRVTLYRTIKTLEEKGVIHLASFLNGENYYAICADRCSSEAHLHEHIHFLCRECATVSCIPLSQPLTLSLVGYKIEHHDVHATGVCTGCLPGQ